MTEEEQAAFYSAQYEALVKLGGLFEASERETQGERLDDALDNLSPEETRLVARILFKEDAKRRAFGLEEELKETISHHFGSGHATEAFDLAMNAIERLPRHESRR